MRTAVGNHPGLAANPGSDGDKFNLNVGHSTGTGRLNCQGSCYREWWQRLKHGPKPDTFDRGKLVAVESVAAGVCMGAYLTAAWTARWDMQIAESRAGRLWWPAKVRATGVGRPYGLLWLSLRIPKADAELRQASGAACMHTAAPLQCAVSITECADGGFILVRCYIPVELCRQGVSWLP